MPRASGRARDGSQSRLLERRRAAVDRTDTITPFPWPCRPVTCHAVQEFEDGETIYHRGEQHPMCFFVHQGVVRLEYADGTIETKVGRLEVFSATTSTCVIRVCVASMGEGYMRSWPCVLGSRICIICIFYVVIVVFVEWTRWGAHQNKVLRGKEHVEFSRWLRRSFPGPRHVPPTTPTKPRPCRVIFHLLRLHCCC